MSQFCGTRRKGFSANLVTFFVEGEVMLNCFSTPLFVSSHRRTSTCYVSFRDGPSTPASIST